MHQPAHHIRILAGFEIVPSDDYRPTLERDQAQALAEALAQDLSKQLPESHPALLVVAGLVVEPSQALQPNFPLWQALEQLAKPTIRDQGLASNVMAIGAHDKQMPDDRLQPKQHTLLGQMVVVPMLLVTDTEHGPDIEATLEANLFESGSINPPARALLEAHAGLSSIHGQLLTLNDLLALQRVQLDAAALSGFWEAVEVALIDPDLTHHLDLPGEVTATWQTDGQHWAIDFLTFDHWALQFGDGREDFDEGYGLWVRAYRTLVALLDTHAIDWQLTLPKEAVLDEHSQCVIEPAHSNISADTVNSLGTHLTEHIDPQLGVLAWTLIEEGRMMHLYPTTARAIRAIRSDLDNRQIQHIERADGLCYTSQSRTLQSLALKS